MVIIITWVCNSFCKINEPTNPVAPVRSTLPLVNLFLFRFTALQNNLSVLSELKMYRMFVMKWNWVFSKIFIHYILESSTRLLSSSIKFTSLDVDMFWSNRDPIALTLGFRNKSCTCNWLPNVSFNSPITLAANNECLKLKITLNLITGVYVDACVVFIWQTYNIPNLGSEVSILCSYS